ncbi:hypothetical protein A3C94_02205 [Candidatus Kaiserbacteria bacterium RIFCSPHIGHO2_02_FULL_55_17]|uniref:Metallo-beta-lactamase domain-containing protein n=1 Tax=Candidatus Kaiserbacteria bacterium RIFCSPHIGHO2_02_FULL_55_17 TaxID=1798496 RepID=A0A1F6DUH8_9BACT|nr:MAG: hypothetical protein A3C94_02205 [Candidatus Kaiserbacteria bacterium RIFCSPHIGHO2_02_FULL_55_17]
MLHELPKSFYVVLLLILIAANVSLYRTVLAPRALEISVLDVGEKGSAALMRAPNGKTILIDTGPDASILRALGAALPPWQRRIDTIILTGAKTSFVGGLPEVKGRYRVSKLIYIGDSSIPYGTRLTLASAVSLDIISPGTFTISYGVTSFKISSSTPKDVYFSNGITFTKN